MKALQNRNRWRQSGSKADPVDRLGTRLKPTGVEGYDGYQSNEEGISMKQLVWVIVVVWSPVAFAVGCPSGQAKDEGALVQLEQSWAKALEHKNSDTVACILAAEFQDIDPYGQVHSRTESLARIAQRSPWGNQLSDLQPHVYGDFGYVRGLNTVVDAEGKTIAKVRFTDIFVYRDGRWLAVAGQESLVTEPPK